MSKKSTREAAQEGPAPIINVRKDAYLTTVEVAQILKLSEGKVRKLADDDVLRCERDGSDYRRFHPTDVAHFLFLQQARAANVSIRGALQRVHEAGLQARITRRER